MVSVTKSGSSERAAPDASTRQRKPKKTYDHVMSEQEKFAVAIVLQARKACNIIIDSIRSGNGAKGRSLQAASALSDSAASLAFGDKPVDPQS